MITETRDEVIQHAARWCMNILAELSSNHGPHISRAQSDYLSAAVRSLAALVTAPVTAPSSDREEVPRRNCSGPLKETT